jgi:polyhydroxyalkanoate synthesis repressor PhaR
MADADQPASPEKVVIKKYANRRLYNTRSSAYVTLEHLSEMVKEGVDFVVYDAKSNEDITRSVLTQIIFDEENRGQNLLPIQFLRQLIRFYGDSMQAFVPSYLELSLDSFTRQQERMRTQVAPRSAACRARASWKTRCARTSLCSTGPCSSSRPSPSRVRKTPRPPRPSQSRPRTLRSTS